jgi:hypothetical protein
LGFLGHSWDRFEKETHIEAARKTVRGQGWRMRSQQLMEKHVHYEARLSLPKDKHARHFQQNHELLLPDS